MPFSLRVPTTVGAIWVDESVFRSLAPDLADLVVLGRWTLGLRDVARLLERGLDFSETNPDFDPARPETLDPTSSAAMHLSVVGELPATLVYGEIDA